MSDYIVIPAKDLPSATIIRYWSDLFAYLPNFQDRWNHLTDPTIQDALEATDDPDTLTFFAFRPKQDLTPIGEFTLEPLGMGLYLTHYSANPTIKMPLIEKFDVSIYFHRLAFGTHASTLIGITPIDNKKAIATALRFGYKQVDIIENGAKSHGELIDAVMTILTRKHFYEIYGDRP